MYSIDFPPEYNNWDRVDPLTLFGAPTVKMEANPKLRTGLHLVQEKQAWIAYLLFNLLQDAEALPDGGCSLSS